MRKVVVLNQYARPLSSAGGTRHVELFSTLRDWEYRIISAYGPDAPQEDTVFLRVNVRPNRGNGWDRIFGWCQYGVNALIELRKRNIRLDLVYASSPHLLTALVGEVLARKWSVPLIFEVRDPWPDVFVAMGRLRERSLSFRVMRRLEERAYRVSSKIVVLSRGVEEVLKGRGVPHAKIHYIPNAANVDFFKVETPREVLRDRFGFSGFTFVYAGAHGPANGLDLLLDAAKRVPEVSVVLVGWGIRREPLRTRVEKEGISNVRFMDPLPKNEMPQLLKAADCGVQCLADVALFRQAVSPNKLFDYMAAGLPVLTNVPGEVGSLVSNAKSGVAVDPGDLAAGMHRIMCASSGDRDIMGENGRTEIRLNHSRREMGDRLSSLLDSLVDP